MQIFNQIIPSVGFIRSVPQQQQNSFGGARIQQQVKCERQSFDKKRKFLYRILIELKKLTGNQGILQFGNQQLRRKFSFFINVDEFFEQILSSIYQKYIVDTVIELSKKIQNQPFITDQDKQEFIKDLKISQTQRKDSLCKQKRKKTQLKLEQQVQNQNENIQNSNQNSIQVIIDNLIEIFCKDQ